MLIAYIAGIAFVAGIAVGAVPAWKYQQARLDAVQAKYDGFVATTKVIGEQAAKDAKKVEAADKLKKEKSDAEFKVVSAANVALARKLREARSHSNYLPPAAATSSSPERACFQRTELESAIGRLDTGVSGIAEKGDAARIGLDTAKGWAQAK